MAQEKSWYDDPAVQKVKNKVAEKTTDFVMQKGAELLEKGTGVPVTKVAGLMSPELWGKAKEAAQGWWNTMAAPAREGTQNLLTTTAMEAGGFKGPAPTDDVSRVPRFRSERSVGEPYQEGKGWDQRWRKEEGEYPRWAKAAYENPEVVANIAGSVVPAAAVVGTGSALNWWAQGDKPRSDYAYNVNPARGSYNSSVESAEASAFYKHQLEEQKFAHKMELMNAREQSRTPGVQNTSMGSYGGGPMDNSAIIGLLQNQFGNTRTYF
jgi:hypothetical protein